VVPIQKVTAIFIGSLLVSIGINGFLVPHHLLDGGITGVALILHYSYGFPTGLAMFLLSSPIFIYAWFYERAFFYNSFLGLLVASTMIDLFAPLSNEFSLSILTSVLLGGSIIGIGVGIMVRFETNTGGTDMVAQFISKAFSLNVGIVMILIDAVIVTAAFQTLGMETFIFSSLAIFLIGFLTSFISKPMHT